MARVLADNGVTLLVEGDDGVARPVVKSAYERAFIPEPPPQPSGMFSELPAPGPVSDMPLGASPDLAGPLPEPEPQLGAFGMRAKPEPAPVVGPTPEFQVDLPPEPRRGKAKAVPAAPPVEGPRSVAEINQASKTADEVEADVIDTGAELERQELGKVTDALTNQDTAIGKIEKKQVERHESGMQAAAVAAEDGQKAWKEFNESKVERQTMFSNTNTWQKILLGISIGISTIGQAKSRRGGPSAVMKVIDDAIEADLADQREKRAHLGEVAKQKDMLYDKILARTNNEYAAGELYKARIEKETARKLDLIAKESQSEKVKNQALGMKVELERRSLDREKNFGQAIADEAYRAEGLKIQKSQNALGWAQFNWNKEKHEEAAKAASAKAAAEGLLVNTVTGEVIGRSRFTDGKQVVEDQDKINNEVAWRAKLTELQRKTEEYGRSGVLDSAGFAKSQEAAELDALYSDAMAYYTKSVSGATVSDAEREELKKSLPSRQGIGQRSNPATILDQRRARGDEELKGFLRSRGIPNEVRDEKGNLVGGVNAFFEQMDVVHRPKPDPEAEQRSPTEKAFISAETGKTAADRTKGWKTLYGEAKRKPGTVLGVDVVTRAEKKLAATLADPNASNEEKAWAGETVRTIRAANKKEFDEINKRAAQDKARRERDVTSTHGGAI